jgi:hypothetical protein
VRYFVAFLLAASLSACGDPLAKIEKFDDVELAEEKPIAQALPDAAEIQAEGGFLSRLIVREPVDAAVVSTDATPPETTLPTETDLAVTTALADAQAGPTPEPAPGGIRGWLRRSADRANAADKVTPTAQVVAEEPEQPIISAPAEVTTTTPEVAEPTPETTPAVVVEAQKRKGLFGIFKPAEAEGAQVRTASLSPAPAAPHGDAWAEPSPAVSVEPPQRRGLFGNAAANAPRNGPDARDVDYGAILPFGEVARVCSARGRPMGRKIDKAPARGRGYALFDSDPNGAGQRTFYVTGFADGCPRQFTAALALMGAPTLHEQLRYGRPSAEYPYSTTDKAYEKVKSSVCRVGKRKPCGAKIGELEKNTVFISTYERFGGNARWADILIHDGAVLAAAIKKP